MRAPFHYLLGLCLLCCGIGCAAPEYVLLDFETEADLDKIHWNCRTLFARSTEYASQGHYGLKFDMFPTDYPGFSLPVKMRDWRPYQMFRLDIFHQANQPQRFHLRFDDRSLNAPDTERCYIHLDLQPGWNHINIPLTDLIAHGSKRPLNRKNICRITFFAYRTTAQFSLYFDYIRLTRE